VHTIFPAAQVISQFTKPVKVKQYGIGEYAEIVRLKPMSIGGLGLHSWNRIVKVEKREVNPYAVAPHIKGGGVAKSSIIPFIESVVREPLIKDISFTVATIDDPDLITALDDYQFDEPTAAMLMLARVYPNNIHIADIYYQNPYQPIPESKRRYEWAAYRGLKMLGPTIVRLEDYARTKGCEYLTLTAAADDLIPLFATLGFTLETNDFGRMARAMEKRL
jgi:hypothetical protein